MQFNTCFELHYDDKDPNAPLKSPSPGLIHAREVALSTTPAPFSGGTVLTDYVAELSADPNQPSSAMLRALVGNQAEIIKRLTPVLAIETGGAYAHENRNDKLHDIAAGLMKVIGKSELAARYSWLSPTLGNVFGSYSLSVFTGLNAAVMASGAASGAAFASAATGRKLLARLQSVSLVQRTTDLALKSLLHQTPLRVPLQVTKRYPAGKAIYLLYARGGYTPAQAAGLIRNGHIDITLVTDNHEMARFGGDVDAAVRDGAGKVETPARPTPALLLGPAGVRGVSISDIEFDKLWRSGQAKLQDAKKMVDDALKGQHGVVSSLDGRLALGGLLLNGLMIVSNLGAIDDHREEVRRAAWFGLADASAGTLGALAGVWEVVLKSRLEHQVGKAAVERSVAIHSLRAAGHILGGVAGVVNAVGNWTKAADAEEAGEWAVATFYRISTVAFFGTGITFGSLAGGAIADRMISKGTGRALAQRIAVRFGARGVLAAAISGWGTVLLLFAVLFEVGAVMMTPTEMQKWAKRSRFGTGSDGKKFGNWSIEEAYLLKLLSPFEEFEQRPKKQNSSHQASGIVAP